MENMNPHIFLDFVLKKNQNKKKYIYLLKKNMTNFTATFLHGNGCVNTFFHKLVKKNPQAPKLFLSMVLHIFNFFAFSSIYVSNKKKITI